MRWIVPAGALAAVLASSSASALPPVSGAVGARVLVSPVSLTIDVAKDPVKAGKDFNVKALVANNGSVRLQNVSVSLVAQTALVLRDPRTQVLAKLNAGATHNVRWTACTTTPGSYVVLARALQGPFVVESAAFVVQVVSVKKPTC